MTTPERGQQGGIDETVILDLLGRLTPGSVERMRLHGVPTDIPGVSPETAAAVLEVSRHNNALTREVIQRWDAKTAAEEAALFAHPS